MSRRGAAEWSPGALAPLLEAEDRAALSWQDSAACASADPEAFFPEKGGSTKAAKRVCAACLVRTECLEFAFANDEQSGIWGGLSEQERSRIKRGRPVVPLVAVAPVPAAGGPRLCGKGLHVLPLSGGRCRACQLEYWRSRDHAAAYARRKALAA